MNMVLIRPNRAIAAEIMDFVDRAFYSDGGEAKNWKRLYRKYAVVLWNDRIKQQEHMGNLCQEWMDAVNGIQMYAEVSNFHI